PHHKARRERPGHRRLPRPRTGPRQPLGRYPRRHLQPGGDLLLLPHRADAVQRGDGGPETDLAPNAPAQADSSAAPGSSRRTRGGRREDEGHGPGAALPDASGGRRGADAVDEDTNPTPAGGRDAPAEPGGDGKRARGGEYPGGDAPTVVGYDTEPWDA